MYCAILTLKYCKNYTFLVLWIGDALIRTRLPLICTKLASKYGTTCNRQLNNLLCRQDKYGHRRLSEVEYALEHAMPGLKSTSN